MPRSTRDSQTSAEHPARFTAVRDGERIWIPPMPPTKRSWLSRWDVTAVVAALVIVGAVGVGAVLTGWAIMDGNVAGSLWRFAAATAIGTYYLLLYRTAQRRR